MKAVLFAGLFLVSAPLYAITVEDTDAIEGIVNQVILKNQPVENTGIGISIFSSKKIILQKGYGHRDQEKKQIVDAHTAFAIGSTTKAFTSLGLKLLENNHQLKITDRVLDHLKDFKISNQMITENATIEDLLSHRIGMPRHDLMTLLTNFSRNENFRRMQYLTFPDNASENFRKTFAYNNLLFLTAGKVIEEVSGDSYENYIQKNILDTLVMKETFLNIPTNYSNLAQPYYKNTRTEHADISDIAPAGSIYSSASDMTKWIQSFMNKEWEGQADFFKTRIGLDNKSPDLKYGYGLGWMINSVNPKASWAFHGGNIFGFSAFVLFSQELDLGMVVLVNQDSDNLGNLLAAELIKYELSKVPVEKSYTKKKPFIKFENLDSSLKINKATFELSDRSEFKTFENPGYGIMKTYKQGGVLFAEYYGNIWELKNIEDDTFNFVTNLTVGGDRFEFPFKIDEEKILAPFQDGVPFIDFKRH